MATVEKIGFGGGCHWCTEAVFQAIKGVLAVDQGWISSTGLNSDFSEAVVVDFDATQISLKTLIDIHLATHSCTSKHSMRNKYRSAVYTFSEQQAADAQEFLKQLQQQYNAPLITQILPFSDFKINTETYQEYYLKNPDKPFCQRYIKPKLSLLETKFNHVFK